MRTKAVIISAGVIASAVLYGQSFEPGTQAYQFAAASSPVNQVFTYTTIGGPTVTGRPYSASEERKSTQTLGDGTRIETTEANRLFRDERGRTRIERKDGSISIYDPVEGFNAELNPATKTATKMVFMVRQSAGGGRTPAPATVRIETLRGQIGDPDKVAAEQRVTELRSVPPAPGEFFPRTVEGGQATFGVVTTGRSGAVISGGGGRGNVAYVAAPDGPTVLRVGPGNDGAVESLPAQMVNGVLSHGTRTTETIPVGKIGNDRAISIVNERWYSDDLQMLIKSSSSDPRFGNSTYQLSNILQTSPDPSLFQIPADFVIRK